MPLKKSLQLVEETQRKSRILLIELTIRRSHFHLKTLRKVSKLFTKHLMLIETLLTIPTESNITHPTERSYLLFLSYLPDELKKLVQNKDRKSGLFSNKSTVTNGTNLINLNLTQRRKLLNSTMKITLTSISLKIGTLKVKNSRV